MCPGATCKPRPPYEAPWDLDVPSDLEFKFLPWEQTASTSGDSDGGFQPVARCRENVTVSLYVICPVRSASGTRSNELIQLAGRVNRTKFWDYGRVADDSAGTYARNVRAARYTTRGDVS